MYEVSSFRLYVLRAMYLLVVVGLGIVLWPGIIHHTKQWDLMGGTVVCMLAAFSIMCALGLRYPLQMLPVLLWEIVWKTLWLAIVALPQWRAGHIDEATQGQLFELSFVVLVYIAVPWRYVWSHYVLKQGDRWTIASSRAARKDPKSTLHPA
ncbi:hypothetical protein ACFOLJ_30295 [Rugamonas sp. CCM 8940]|uniref:hypothetical protein n=1 Tax=Rugamonas sp. CCM 8940 TaxID=2765359 RepID=UPI0018F69803|nr:hypothetical protein [Rugamonas sp. CCM 8940]MBJ7313115.1 hypothetical protein [Rugamonas sp. CCM 8940]